MTGVNIERVAAFMKKKKLSEQEFAKAMGISHSYLFRVLRNDRQAGRKFIEGLIKAGMKPKDIFSGPPLTNVKTGTDG